MNAWRVALAENALVLIEKTPLLPLKNERILAKVEFLDPDGSIKDPVALALLEVARGAIATVLPNRAERYLSIVPM